MVYYCEHNLPVLKCPICNVPAPPPVYDEPDDDDDDQDDIDIDDQDDDKKVEILVVDGVEYDISGLSFSEKTAIKILKLSYENFSRATKDLMSFEVYVYKLSQVRSFYRIFTDDDDDDDD
ncbi:unnamed protein product, partial [marine sediment metagenome]